MGMDMPTDRAGARIVFLVRVPAERTDEFLRAYQDIRFEVARTAGHRVDQLCRSTTDPEQWLITSEWRSLADFEVWERSDAHRELVAPLRRCLTDPRSLRFVVHEQTVGAGPYSPGSP
jgi:heme-degrading monooxygenase HmoA